MKKKDSSKDEIINEQKKTDHNNIIRYNGYIRKGANKKYIREKKNIEKIRDKNLKENVLNKYNLPKSYYLLFFLMIGLAGLSLKFVLNSRGEYYEENYAVFNSQDISYDEKNDDNQNLSSKTNNLDTRKNEESSLNSNNIKDNNAENILNNIQKNVENKVISKEEPLVFIKPIDGEISKIYSNDKVIYSKTLDMWKIHDGIDVLGNIGDNIYSCERGKVEKIYNDAFYGLTIVIDHGQGYKSSYSNLDEETYVKIGDSVKKNQKIGKLGNTSIGEIKDLPHLHFMLYKNEEITDPTSIFK